MPGLQKFNSTSSMMSCMSTTSMLSANGLAEVKANLAKYLLIVTPERCTTIFQGKLVELSDAYISFRTSGKDKAILFLHGGDSYIITEILRSRKSKDDYQVAFKFCQQLVNGKPKGPFTKVRAEFNEESYWEF